MFVLSIDYEVFLLTRMLRGLAASAASDPRRLAQTARASVIECDAVCDAVASQPAEVAERVLAARERALAGVA